MARTKRSAKLDTWNARKKLPMGKMNQEPLTPGQYLAYRRPESGAAGSWFARLKQDGKILQARLGVSDDFTDADGVGTLTFAQAQEKARDWFKTQEEAIRGEADGMPLPPPGLFSVADAMTAYLEHGAREGKKGLTDAQSRSRVYIVPELGSLSVDALTRGRIERWLQDVANSPARVKGKRGQPAREGKAAEGPDAKRARKATANKALAYLKAALTHAKDRNLVRCPDDAWRLVKPFRGVEEARQEYLSPADQVRLINAVADPNFKHLVQGALLTGCRYGELCRLVCEDFEPNPSGHASVLVREGKGGKSRRVLLTNQGREFFESITAGRPATELVFIRERMHWIPREPTSEAPGNPKKRVQVFVRDQWRTSDQKRAMREACEAAKLPPIGFHQLRHSYASALVTAGMPLAMVAKLTGHADTRILEKHYAHLAPSALGKALEALAPDLEIRMPKVAELKIGSASRLTPKVFDPPASKTGKTGKSG